MLARSLLRCAAPRRIVSRQWPRAAKGRRYSTASSSVSGGGVQSTAGQGAPMLAAFTEELDKIAPRFDIRGDQVKVLRTPSEFYETLKDKIRKAEKHIFLSTLYIGKTEHELISVLSEALRAKPELKLSVLTDALRGTRETPSTCSASLLAPLIEEFGPERVEIRMYHTPNLTGLRKKYVPKRINEGWGLQHMKLYGMDDEIIMSGANLSNDYFTNRQDRYHVFSSPEITSYFHKLHSGVSSLSFLVVPSPSTPAGYTLIWPTSNDAPSPLISSSGYITASTARLAPLIKPVARPLSHLPDSDTTIYPLAQLTQLLKPETSTELPAVTSILRALAAPAFAKSSWTFTAGYFNPDPSLTKLLISSASRGTVITASQHANGFFGASGPAGLLPGAYTLYARRFMEAAARAGRGGAIKLLEWRNGRVGEPGGWTYHAKGLWVSMPGEEGRPSMSLVGSSNYTQRSYNLDLEANVLVVTRNEGLMARLGEEERGLREYAEEVGKGDFEHVERRVGVRVRVAMWMVKIAGGAL
ncbi:hypothetical protein VE00_01185 [Pseudogymnoascus sp. WSF 3629]|nr:hypothetical protein VE00_01185 [Pseudogymnoascus sp. WSF 3629]